MFPSHLAAFIKSLLLHDAHFLSSWKQLTTIIILMSQVLIFKKKNFLGIILGRFQFLLVMLGGKLYCIDPRCPV